MFVLVILLPLVAHRSVGSEELNVTQLVSDSLTEATEVISGEGSRGRDKAENVTVSLQDPTAAQATRPKQTPRGPRLARRKLHRSRRFRPGNGPRYREAPYNPINAYNPYYRAPQTYYDVYYNPYQGYYPEYTQPGYAQAGYYPPYPYQPQQPYPQPYPHPPPPHVIPTPPPTLAPIPDLYYVQNTDGHYQYRRVSVTRRPSDSQWSQYSGHQQGGHYNAHDRRPNPDYRYPRRPGRPSAPTEFRPQLRLTSAPYQAQVFGVTSPPPPPQAMETSGG